MRSKIEETFEKIDPKIKSMIEIKGAFMQACFVDFDLDLKRAYFNLFCDEFRDFDLSKIDWPRYNIMSPCGGPLAVSANCHFEVVRKIGASVNIRIDKEWAGVVDFLNNACGMDNLIVLAGYYSLWDRQKGRPQFFFKGECLGHEIETRIRIKEEFYGL